MSDKFLKDLIEFGKRLPKVDPFWESLPPPGTVLDTYTFLRLRVGCLEGWDPDADRATEDLDLVEAVLSERQSVAAKKPRPGRRHPRRDEAMEIARAKMRDMPRSSATEIAILVACDMGGADTPEISGIAKWIISEKRRT